MLTGYIVAQCQDSKIPFLGHTVYFWKRLLHLISSYLTRSHLASRLIIILILTYYERDVKSLIFISSLITTFVSCNYVFISWYHLVTVVPKYIIHTSEPTYYRRPARNVYLYLKMGHFEFDHQRKPWFIPLYIQRIFISFSNSAYMQSIRPIVYNIT